jgi:hypothetical protein
MVRDERLAGVPTMISTPIKSIGFLLLGVVMVWGQPGQPPAIPYLPGQSIGPIAPLADPVYENDLLNYAQAYWILVDSGGMNPGPIQNFVPQSPKFQSGPMPPFGPADHDPFGVGSTLFENIFSHRLQLDPTLGPIFTLDQLIGSDPWVQQQWRFWTRTHQLVTADFLDPIAHQKHIQALINAFTTASEYATNGVPYFDAVLSIVASENTKKLRDGSPLTGPTPLALATLPQSAQNKDALIRQRAVVLSSFGGLYESDGSWFGGHVGFDCDDYADAIGHYVAKGQPGLTATTVNVKWTTTGGASESHRITKFTCGNLYWLVDGASGEISGPHDISTPADAGPVLGDYDIDPGQPVTTQDDGRALGSRPSLAEPPAWHTSPAQVARFESITGLSAACFH